MRVAEAPPAAPASWQTPQPSALKIGPSPSVIASRALKFALKEAKFESVVLVPGIRSPSAADCSEKTSSERSLQPAAPIVVPAMSELARTNSVLLVLVFMSIPFRWLVRFGSRGVQASSASHRRMVVGDERARHGRDSQFAGNVF